MLLYAHHVHYVVEDRDAMIDYIAKTFGMKPDLVRVDSKNGKVAHYNNIGKTQIQVTSPLDPTSSTGKFLTEHGPGVYHVGWGVHNVRQMAQEIADKGNKVKTYGKELISKNEDGDLVCSIDPVSSLGVLFQLVEG